MNRKEFCDAYAKTVGSKKVKPTKQQCREVLDFLAYCIKNNDRVYIKGLGCFKKKKMSPRRAGNFYGDEPIEIPACEKIVFEFFSGDIEEFDIPEDEEAMDIDELFF